MRLLATIFQMVAAVPLVALLPPQTAERAREEAELKEAVRSLFDDPQPRGWFDVFEEYDEALSVTLCVAPRIDRSGPLKRDAQIANLRVENISKLPVRLLCNDSHALVTYVWLESIGFRARNLGYKCHLAQPFDPGEQLCKDVKEGAILRLKPGGILDFEIDISSLLVVSNAHSDHFAVRAELRGLSDPGRKGHHYEEGTILWVNRAIRSNVEVTVVHSGYYKEPD